MYTGTSSPPVPAYHCEPTNQQGDKQRVGICAGTGVLYGRKAEVSLADYFLERRVTDVQSTPTVLG